MKIIKLTTVAILLVSSLFAANTTIQKKPSSLSSDMRSMLTAMEHIQRSGFYQDYDGMIAGVEQLKSGLKSLSKVDPKSYLPSDQQYATKFAEKREKMLLMYANDLAEAAASRDMDQALEDYTQLMNQCTSCHIRLRTW